MEQNLKVTTTVILPRLKNSRNLLNAIQDIEHLFDKNVSHFNRFAQKIKQFSHTSSLSNAKITIRNPIMSKRLYLTGWLPYPGDYSVSPSTKNWIFGFSDLGRTWELLVQGIWT